MIEALDGLGLGGKTQALEPGVVAMAPVPAPLRLANTPNPGFSTPGTATQGTFVTSQTGMGRKGGAPVALIAGGLTLLVMVGGAFAAYKALSGSAAEPAASASAEAASTAAVAPAAPAPAPPTVAPAETEDAPAPPAASVAPTPSAPVPKAAAAPRTAPRPRPAGTKPPAGSTKGPRDFGY
jgi:hypothetical protein